TVRGSTEAGRSRVASATWRGAISATGFGRRGHHVTRPDGYVRCVGHRRVSGCAEDSAGGDGAWRTIFADQSGGGDRGGADAAVPGLQPARHRLENRHELGWPRL